MIGAVQFVSQRNIADNDRLPEDCSVKDIADCAVGTFHICFGVKFFFTLASSGVIVAHLMPTPCSLMALAASSSGNLVTLVWSRCSYTEIIIFDVQNLNKAGYELVFDELPNYPGQHHRHPIQLLGFATLIFCAIKLLLSFNIQ